jgi:hypothetical protein
LEDAALDDWKLWAIYRVSRGNREMVGTRVGLSADEALSALRFESFSRFEAEECDDPCLYERAVLYHETMSARRDLDSGMALDHGRRAKGLRRSLRRLSGRAA